MKVFFLDLWMDLREKRLAPVAIILLLALIAVPIVLANGSDESTAPTTSTPSATVASAAVVKGSVSDGSTDSKLQTFSSRDPFEPSASVAQTTTTTTSSGGASSGGSSSDTSSAGSTGRGGSQSTRWDRSSG